MPGIGYPGIFYQSKMEEGGPIHVIRPGFKIGSSVDPERNAIVEDATAQGDDTDGLPDESGVVFPPNMVLAPGGSITITVSAMNMTGAAAVLQGWIDWDNNGVLDPTDQILPINVPVGGLSPQNVVLPIPANADFDMCMLYARFRLSPNGGLGPNGPADKFGPDPIPQGEVEDYKRAINTVPPVMNCPADIVKNNDPGRCGAVITYPAPMASDECTGWTLSLTKGQLSNTLFPIGKTVVEWKVTDLTGYMSSCSFSVTVNDVQLPTVTCPVNIVKWTAPGQCTAPIFFAVKGYTDNCAGLITPTIISTGHPASGANWPIGDYTVTYEVKDPSDNTAQCSFTVKVSDGQAPSITCPQNQTKNTDADLCTAAVTYAPVVTDNCPGATVAAVNPSHASGQAFNKGVTTVVLRATDAAGLTKSCSFRVTVNDRQAPVITCDANQSVNTATGQCSAVVTYTDATFTDNCAPTSGTAVRVSGLPSGAAFPKGTTNVVYRATDASGNFALCTVKITVTDNEKPKINCPTVPNRNTDPGKCGAAVSYSTPISTDNCPGVQQQLLSGLASGSSFPVGSTTVRWQAKDAVGLTETCQFTVTVVDNQGPTIICPPNTTIMGGPGNCTIPKAQLPSATAQDNCGVTSLSSNAPADVPAGTIAVTWTAVAGSQQAQCQHNVTVMCGTSYELGVMSYAKRESPSSLIPHPLYFTLSPNPASESVLVLVSGIGEAGAELNLYDALGRQIWRKTLVAGVEQIKIDLTTNEFTDGMYQVTLRTDDKVITKSLVVTRR
jgi:HYR domain/GEVED domain/Secretion system C-terminal sorting domain